MDTIRWLSEKGNVFVPEKSKIVSFALCLFEMCKFNLSRPSVMAVPGDNRLSKVINHINKTPFRKASSDCIETYKTDF